MTDIRLPGFTHIDLGWAGGPYDEMAHPKLCWHTTEGATLAGAERAFRLFPPHIGVDPRTGERHQYVPLNRHSYALAGSESDDEYVIQVEVVGFARQSHTWPDEVLSWLGRHVVRPIRDAVGVPDTVISHGFRREGGGIVLASSQSPIRISLAQLRAFSGHLGHQHMPAPNSHWDPGGLPIHRILAHAGAAAPSASTAIYEEDHMYVTCHELGRSAVSVGGKLVELTDPAERTRAQAQINAERAAGRRDIEVRLAAGTFLRALGEA